METQSNRRIYAAVNRTKNLTLSDAGNYVDVSPLNKLEIFLTHRLCLALAVVALFVTGSVAQTVRFETNVGSFELVLNPTNDSRLQGSVDNLLQYVTSGRYDNTVINRAETDFVIQMGLYQSPGAKPPATVSGFEPITPFAPILGNPAQNLGLFNESATVGYGLSGVNGFTDIHSATSSFYINLGNNYFLDKDFTVFAAVPDMATINAIVALPHANLTSDPNFGASADNYQFTNVPLLPNGDLVVISHAFVVGVPEPATCALVGCVLPLWLGRRSRRRR